MARNLGFKGTICPHPSWVEPVNIAFSPTSEQVAYYTRVREVFAEGVARGTAAVPLDGKMIDVPVDEWAKAVLHLAALCQARDQEKHRALQRAAVAHA
jgi:citrate lyase subunit beta/citryl-CoA lyase